VEELILADRRILIDSATTALGCSHDLAWIIVQDRLKFRKVCAHWVPRELKDREKMKRVGLSSQHLLRYKDADEGEDTSILKRIVTGDETWVHHNQPESKRASVQWKVMLKIYGILRECSWSIFRSMVKM
jgi:hypothetical protein